MNKETVENLLKVYMNNVYLEDNTKITIITNQNNITLLEDNNEIFFNEETLQVNTSNITKLISYNQIAVLEVK